MSKTLSKKQISDIESLIRDTHFAFMVELGGTTAIDADDLRRIRDRGLVRDGGSVGLLQRGYQFGLLSGGMGTGTESSAEAITPGSFIAYLNSEAGSLSAQDQRLVRDVTDHIETYVRAMGTQLEMRFQKALVEADKHLRRLRQHVVERVVSEGAEHGDAVRNIAVRLKRAMKDARHEWDKVAATELHNLIQEGRAAAIKSKAGVANPRVYKQPKPDACQYCKILFLEADGTPRIFHLADLVANGSNIDRKANRPVLIGPAATHWKPTLDSVHPFCQCELHHVPKGYAFEKGKLRYVGEEAAKSLVSEVSPLDRLLMDHECE